MGGVCGTHGRREDQRNACRLLVAKPDGMRPRRRAIRSWVDNMKMDLAGVEWGMVCNELVWLRIVTSGELLLMR
jgi:hypothetical protein